MKYEKVVSPSGLDFVFVLEGERGGVPDLLRHRILTVPNPKVIDFWKRQDIKVKALFGANRSGKTESAVIEAIWWCLAEHPFRDIKPPVYVRWLMPDYSLIEMTIRPKILRYCSPKRLVGEDWERAYDKRYHRLHFKNGSILEFKSHRVGLLNLEGVSLNLVIIDEEPPYEAYQTLLMRTLDTGGLVLITATPLKGLTWMYTEVLLKGKQGNPDIYCDFLRLEENRFIDTGEVQRTAKLMGGDKAMSRLYGDFTDQRIFPALGEHHLSTVPEDGVYYGGLDWGYNHMSAYVGVKVSEGVVYVVDVFEERYKSLGEFVAMVEERCKVRGQYPELMVYDSQLNQKDTNEFVPATKVIERFSALPATKKQQHSLSVVNELLRRNLIKFDLNTPAVVDFFYRLQRYCFVEGKEVPKENDDSIDAFRYVVYWLCEAGYLQWSFQYAPQEEEVEVEDMTYNAVVNLIHRRQERLDTVSDVIRTPRAVWETEQPETFSRLRSRYGSEEGEEQEGYMGVPSHP
jgi:phage terminase large subunit-like protein